jgi:hypothetical protein
MSRRSSAPLETTQFHANASFAIHHGKEIVQQVPPDIASRKPVDVFLRACRRDRHAVKTAANNIRDICI